MTDPLIELAQEFDARADEVEGFLQRVGITDAKAGEWPKTVTASESAADAYRRAASLARQAASRVPEQARVEQEKRPEQIGSEREEWESFDWLATADAHIIRKAVERTLTIVNGSCGGIHDELDRWALRLLTELALASPVPEGEQEKARIDGAKECPTCGAFLRGCRDCGAEYAEDGGCGSCLGLLPSRGQARRR